MSNRHATCFYNEMLKDSVAGCLNGGTHFRVGFNDEGNKAYMSG